jgi:hypothetical protein
VTSALPIAEHLFFRPPLRVAPLKVGDSSSRPAAREKKSYPLPFWSGFFERKHYKAMGGGPVFLFGYLVDKTTKEDFVDQDKLGIVLGGKPITDGQIGKHYGISPKTVARFREVLIEQKYIDCQRTPYGYRYTVRKSKKFGIWSEKRTQKRSDNIVQSEGVEIGQLCPERSDNSVRNKEDHAVDHAVKQQPAALPKQEDSVWNVLGIDPCGPASFRTLLDSCWSTRNGNLPSVAIGTALDAWEDTQGAKPPRCARLFRALSELRKRESVRPARKERRVPSVDQMIPQR